jgi:putative heme-binding domain-containing protein
VATDGRADVSWRVEAIPLLAAVPFAEIGELLLALVNPPEPVDVQLAALRTLARFSDPRVGTRLIQRWGGMTDRVRAAALDVLLQRAEGCEALLVAVQSGRIRREELSSTQLLFLRSHPEATVSRRANALPGLPGGGDRNAALKRLLPALELRGDAARGRQSYLARCQQCHRFRGNGFAFGPDLEGAAVRGKEWLLTHLVEPNRVVPPRGHAAVVETAHLGRLLGLVEHETPAGVHLLRPFDGRVALPRVAIRSVTRLEMSAMPEGLDAGLTAQAVADLLEWLAPAAR